MSTKIQNNVDLSKYTSFGVGGPASSLAEVHNVDELIEVLQSTAETEIHLLGYGSNTLISDDGLSGLTIVVRGGNILVDDSTVIADAGAWWDDVVKTAIENDLWGLEFMSEIPGSVGAAVFINITAYGQSIGPLIEWVDIWDSENKVVKRLNRSDLQWDYKKSVFQQETYDNTVILRVCLQLHRNSTDTLTYQKAIDVATELGINSETLSGRREIIVEARKRAGSLWSPDDSKATRTVGSFFRNPIVSKEKADFIINFDEFGKTADEIKLMNKVHGGSTKRVSAAHVMLAAGFNRGQTWGNIKLNDQNLLKIETTAGATAKELHDVVMLIQQTCEQKLGVSLEPEARILGVFN